MKKNEKYRPVVKYVSDVGAHHSMPLRIRDGCTSRSQEMGVKIRVLRGLYSRAGRRVCSHVRA